MSLKHIVNKIPLSGNAFLDSINLSQYQKYDSIQNSKTEKIYFTENIEF